MATMCWGLPMWCDGCHKQCGWLTGDGLCMDCQGSRDGEEAGRNIGKILLAVINEARGNPRPMLPADLGLTPPESET